MNTQDIYKTTVIFRKYPDTGAIRSDIKELEQVPESVK